MANVTSGLLPRQDMMVFAIMSVGSSCTFLYINGVLLFTLRSRPVFCETSRYILLFNLLLADTAQLTLGETLYLLAACRIRPTLYLCGVLVMTSMLVATISPLTLMVMSVERYVAVCLPLRHAEIVTIRSTAVAINTIWVFSLVNILIRIFILLSLKHDILSSQPMRHFCSKEAFFFAPMSYYYDKAYSGFVFISVGLTIILSYIGVMLVARSASTDKASAIKAGKTLLLHLIQLGLILPSTIHSVVLTLLAITADKLLVVRLHNIFFVICHILPRCLSALIYGLRDQTIRHVLMSYFSCQQKCSVFPTNANTNCMLE
ncbi:odorant receptor 131-2-like [Lampris incognitus]|uniref:odorant receptor 131-2-like n=1 Tax=Lampris incognitus TaxID=2546036 RepID=UPI0024B51E89|nr:odorant receptor 131-2-like [Lampris incognitus]